MVANREMSGTHVPKRQSAGSQKGVIRALKSTKNWASCSEGLARDRTIHTLPMYSNVVSVCKPIKPVIQTLLYKPEYSTFFFLKGGCGLADFLQHRHTREPAHDCKHRLTQTTGVLEPSFYHFHDAAPESHKVRFEKCTVHKCHGHLH